jgi:hypothetical protein
MGIVSQKLRDSAKGQRCTFVLPGCMDSETVVLCHCRIGNPGMATKPDDFFAAFGCFACHQSADNHNLPRGEEASVWLRAIQRTQRRWVEMGLMTFPVTEHRARQSEKILARRPITRTAT